VTSSYTIANPLSATGGNTSSPSIAVDSANTQKVVSVYTRLDPMANMGQPFVEARWSADGGQTWNALSLPANLIDPASDSNNPQPLAQATDASVAFDISNNFYIVYSEHPDGSASGAIVLQKYSFSGTSPTNTIMNSVAYEWVKDPAFSPVLAVDNNVPSYTDPQSGVTQTDPYSGNVYIAWSTQLAVPKNLPANTFNPNTIQVLGSSDGGKTFGVLLFANSPGPGIPAFLGNEREAAPQLVISQGTSDGRVSPGQVSVVWDDFGSGSRANPPFDLVTTNAYKGGTSQAFSAGPLTDATGHIKDATPGANGAPDKPSVTNFAIPVNITNPGFTTVTSVNVRVDIMHANLEELKLELIAPNGATILLANNREDNMGNMTAGTGLTGANMGISPAGVPIGTIFDQSATWSIVDSISGAAAPYVGRFFPEGNLTRLNGLTKTQVNGTWTLRITDNKSDQNNGADPVQFVVDWAVILNSGLTTLDANGDVVASTTPIRGALTGPYPLLTTADPNRGIGPGIVIAADNTLGSFSPFQGRLYVAYVDRLPLQGTQNQVDNTDISLISSSDGGKTWTAPITVNDDNAVADGFSESVNLGNFIHGRPQFEPAVAVDQTTGTLVVTFYDGRDDPARARVGRYIGTSIDGGQTFSAQTYLNTPGTVFDPITQTFVRGTAFDEATQSVVSLGPIPDNQSTTNSVSEPTFSFGDRQGLTVYGGVVYAAWSGNENGGMMTASTDDGKELLDILGATAVIAAGPRVIDSTMGPVGQPGDALNNTRTADGTPIVSKFTVTFDRPVDPGSFTPNTVTVVYRGPNISGTAPGTFIPVLSVVPLDNGPFGATQFLVTFIPQSGIGTYSYTVGPSIHDRIRTVSRPGNSMDQSAIGIQGASPQGTYAAPQPLDPVASLAAGGYFSPPYNPNTLPLIIPGPYVASSHVVNNPATADNLILNGTVSSIDVVFDRDMDPTSITPGQIVRFIGPIGSIGPNGTVKASFTVTPNPNGTDPNPSSPRTYRINFRTLDGSQPLVLNLNGTYTLTLGSQIRSKNGNLLDTNLNVGLDMLRGTPSAGTQPESFSSTNVPMPIGGGAAGQVTTSTLNVTDNFVVQGLSVTLNITYPNDPDLQAVLVAPNGSQITLFSKVGSTAPGRANFINTVFDDTTFPVTPISQGAPPFTGRFNPQEPLADLGFGKLLSGGTWKLQITDLATGRTGMITSWSLTFLKPIPLTGLGELVADQATVSFRIFTMDPANPLSSNTWTSVGPASIATSSTTPNEDAGRIGGLAMDPSDPSGNTVYIAGASGGVWKTTNFLTSNPNGPTYIPLTNFGPTFSMNIGSIAVFGRNNDPNQSIVFAATGEGDIGSRGVGFLRSMDGGATWTLLDSTTNVDSNGNVLPMSSPLRDHIFVGTSSFKVLVDPHPSPTGDVVIYGALIGANGGVWRSTDTGKHWQLMRAGQATDLVFDPNSGHVNTISNPTGNLEVLFAGFQGDGVYVTPNRGATWSLMAGGVGNPFLQNPFLNPPQAIPVNAPSATPNGPKGRIVLGKPDLTGQFLPDGTYTGNVAQDLIYETWLYALVVTTGGTLDGLYLTKDLGANWTKIAMPTLPPVNGVNLAVPTNDTTNADYSVVGSPMFAQGNYDASLAVDPNNPSVVYVGGTHDGQPSGFIRVDTTGLADPYALYLANNKMDGGQVTFNTTDPLKLRDWPTMIGLPPPLGIILDPVFSPFIDLIRNPFDPFAGDITQFVSNVANFANTGSGATWIPFDIGGSTDQHRIITYRDPLTGLSRIIIGDDQGVYTALARVRPDDTGAFFVSGVGTGPFPGIDRDGNLQITQFYYGASQPSSAAAQIGQALFYGQAQDDGFPASDPNILTNGNIQWAFPPTSAGEGDGTGVATDQTGSGTLYQYNWPCCGGFGTDFFQVNGVGRTFGLIQQTQTGGNVPDPQWPFTGGSNFAVNPVNGNQIAMSSQAGRIFETTDQGRIWFVIGDPTDLDGTYAPAIAYGAPNPTDPTGALNNFLYAGTLGGHIFVTFTGGGATGNQWLDLSAGLDGSSVRSIITNPTRGTHEAFAVTFRGVYHMVDSSAPNARWVNITGNLFSITHNLFGPFADATQLVGTHLAYLEAVVADWRYAIPDNPAELTSPTTPPGPTHPVLYVAGEGGVYRSIDLGMTWTIFPDVADDGAPVDGGYLPNAHITALSLALGNVNPTTGHPALLAADGSAAPDILLATTYGRGEFAIRLAPIIVPGSLHLDPNLPAPTGSVTGTTTQPVIDGVTELGAFGNKVKIQLYDQLANGTRVPIGVDVNNASQPFTYTDAQGRFQIQVKAGAFSSDGLHTLVVTATDDAGVVSPVQSITYLINTTPIINAASIALDPTRPGTPGGSDSGLTYPFPGAMGTFTDRITNVSAPWIAGTLSQAGPTLIQLYDVTNPANPRLIGSGMSNADGTFSVQVTPGSFTTDGVKLINIVAVHQPTNGQLASPFSFTLITTPPPQPPQPNLAPASDAGFSNTDHITNVTTPTFSGTGTPGDQVQLYAVGIATPLALGMVDASGNYTVTVGTPLADGTYTIYVRLSDLAGNLSPLSIALQPLLTIKTTPPSKPTIQLDAAYQTGPGTTSSVPQVYDGTADPGTQVTITDNGVVVDTFLQPSDSNTFSRTLSLAQGTHVLTVQSSEIAGNVAVSDNVVITVNMDTLDPDRKFIRQIYFDALGRLGSLTEWNIWVPFLQQTNGRAIIASAIETSLEARDFLVKGWYQTYLGRTAMNGEELGWANLMVNGMAPEQVLSFILASPEYFAHAATLPGIGGAPSDGTFVTALYMQILNRVPIPAEVNNWVALIPQIGLQGVAFHFLVSPEYRTDVVESYYSTILRRTIPPSPDEVAGWVNSGLDIISIRAGFESSVEFYFRVTGFVP
jgi:subtilisin-like proprotein convertase family protein